MKRFMLGICVAALALAQPNVTAITQIFGNSAGAGTVQNGLVALGTQGRVVKPTAGATDGVIGICHSGCGVDGLNQTTIVGSDGCLFDGATTLGDWVQIGATGYECHDTGSATLPTSGGQVIGLALSTNASAGIYGIQLQLRNNGGTSSGGPPSGSAGGDLGGTYPNPTATNGSHITNSSIPNSGLVNTGTTVNGESCVLGSTCTVDPPSGSVDYGQLVSDVMGRCQVTLSSTDIKAMEATPVAISCLGAQGSGTLIEIVSICYNYLYSTAVYTGGANGGWLYFGYGSTAQASIPLPIGSDLLNSTENTVGFQSGFSLDGYPNASSVMLNQGIYVTNQVAPFASGSGTLYLDIVYRVVSGLQ